MRVTTIGSGTGAPSGSRVSSAHIVTTGDAVIMLDCGSGSVHRMSALGVDWMSITHVAITHFHADHISDIPTLIYAWRYGTLPPRKAAVTFLGPPGFAALLNGMDALFGGDFHNLGFALEVRELPPGEKVAITPGTTVAAHKVPHTDESIAYSIQAGRRRVIYTGDTPMDTGLAEWASGCDLLLAECSLPDELAVPTHMTPAQCGELAAMAAPAALALTHFYPPLDRMDVAGMVRARYAGPVHLAYDGWTIELED
jgi:ribonuclease BN (tRNA processing enzyme)